MKEQRLDDPSSAATTTGAASAPAPGKGTLVEQTYGAPTRVASAPAHAHHHGHPLAVHPHAQPSSTNAPSKQPDFNAVFKAIAFKKHGHEEKMIKVWTGRGRWDGDLPRHFEGQRGNQGWSW